VALPGTGTSGHPGAARGAFRPGRARFANPALDPVARIPELKACAVRVETL